MFRISKAVLNQVCEKYNTIIETISKLYYECGRGKRGKHYVENGATSHKKNKITRTSTRIA